MDSEDQLLNELDYINNVNSFACNTNELPNLLPSDKPAFSIITQNIRSINKNSDDFSVSLSLVEEHIDILILTKCRLNPDIPLPNRPGYYVYNTTNKVTQNDGVVVYINDTLEHKVKEIFINDATCLQVCLTNLIILCIYRSPSNYNIESFVNSLEQYLQSNNLSKNVIITGDININLLEGHLDARSHKYLETMAQYGLLPGHRLNTRINSCIDHVFANLDPNKYSATIAVLEATTTDHSMVLTYIYSKSDLTHRKSTKVFIDYKSAVNTLNDNNLAELIKIEDPNTLSEKLIEIINKSIETNTKVIKIPSNKRIIKPWITPGLLKCIKNRNRLQKQSQQNKENETLSLIYKRYRNFCNNLLKKLKRKYEQDLLLKAKNNNKLLLTLSNKFRDKIFIFLIH